MTALDTPEQLVLRGTSDEDVPSISTQFGNRVDLKRDLDTRPDKIDKGAIHCCLSCLKKTAAETYN